MRVHWLIASTLLFVLLQPFGGGVARGVEYPVNGFDRLHGVVVRAFHQDSLGYLWLATDSGVWRWCGGRFQRLQESIPTPAPVNCLLEDAHQTLWIGTDDGLVGVDVLTLQVRPYSPLLPGVRIYSAYRDAEGQAWIGAMSGLHRLMHRSDTDAALLVEGSRTHQILAMAPGLDGELWAGTHRSLLRVTGEQVVAGFEDLLCGGHIRGLLRSSDGALWVGVRTPGGLYRLHDGEVTGFGEEEGLLNNEVNCIVEHPDGDIWVATEDGAFRWRNGRFTALDRTNGLPTGDIHALYVDREEHLWIGTYGSGAFRLRSPDIVAYSMADGLAHPMVTALARAGDNRLVVGTVHGAALFDLGLSGETRLLAQGNIRAVYVDHAGEMWIAADSGVMRARDGMQVAPAYPTCLGEDATGGLLIGYDRRLFRYVNGEIGPVRIPEEIIGQVQAIELGADGAVYVGTDRGLGRLVDNAWVVLLADRDIRAVYAEGPDALWLGTLNGLVYWSSSGVRDVVGDGEHGHQVRDIIRDGQGAIWAATDRGVLRVNGDQVERFSYAHGLPSGDVSGLATAADGCLFAGTTQGLARIDVQRLRPCATRPLCVVGSFSAGGRRYYPGRIVSELPFNQRDVSFELEDLGWRYASGSQYQYQLIGHDKGWSEWMPRDVRSYVGLQPGQYTFLAKVRNERGIEGRTRPLSFVILPPFWRTAWFVGLALLTLLIVVAASMRAYVRRCQLRREAEAATRAKSEFVSCMSHEIRTPLAVILGCAETLADPRLSRRHRAERVDTIIRNGRHLLEVVNRVMDLSKLSRGGSRPESLPFALRSLLDDVRTIAVHRVADKPVAVELDVDDRVPEFIVSDPTRLQQILVNLMDNAVKFTSDGFVRLGVSQTGGIRDECLTLRFMVIDTGLGIAPEQREAVFDAFRQADSSITRRYGGTGLGLTIARSLAVSMGGELHLVSETGWGTTLTLDLPTRIAREDDVLCRLGEQGEKEEGTLAKVRILVADDSVDLHRVLEVILENAGAEVHGASNGREAIGLAAQADFDVILVDIHMPDMDGFAVVRELHERGVDVPLIAVTADATDETRLRCLEVGFDDLICKPFEGRDLISRIRDLCPTRPTFQPAERFASKRPAPEQDAPPGGGEETDDGPIFSSLAGQGARMAEVTDDFVRKVAEDVALMEEALAGRAFESIGDVAHRLKGSGGTTGYMCVTEVAARIEKAALAEKAAVLEQHILDLRVLHRRMLKGIGQQEEV